MLVETTTEVEGSSPPGGTNWGIVAAQPGAGHMLGTIRCREAEIGRSTSTFLFSAVTIGTGGVSAFCGICLILGAWSGCIGVQEIIGGPGLAPDSTIAAPPRRIGTAGAGGEIWPKGSWLGLDLGPAEALLGRSSPPPKGACSMTIPP